MLLRKQIWTAALLVVAVGCTQAIDNSNDPEVQSAPALESAPAAAATSATAGDYVRAEMPKTAGPADSDAPEEFTTTESGLKYRVLRKADGKKPTAADSVTVNYHGWTANGNVFDSSYDRGETIDFPLGGVIAGWTEGLQLIGEGGMIELEIPGNLAYGPNSPSPDIPPNATLYFLVELKKVN